MCKHKGHKWFVNEYDLKEETPDILLDAVHDMSSEFQMKPGCIYNADPGEYKTLEHFESDSLDVDYSTEFVYFESSETGEILINYDRLMLMMTEAFKSVKTLKDLVGFQKKWELWFKALSSRIEEE